MISTLAADDDQRTAFLKTCLKKLGLRLPDSEETVPCFTSLHLSSYPPSQISHLVQSWEELITDKEPGNEGLIVGDIDAFLLSQPDQRHALGGPQGVATQSRTSTAENKVRVSLEGKPADDLPLQDQGYYWPLITHETALPPSSQTVSFSHESYFQYLSELNGNGTKKYPAFGSYLLYGEVVTSTNDILHKYAPTH